MIALILGLARILAMAMGGSAGAAPPDLARASPAPAPTVPAPTPATGTVVLGTASSSTRPVSGAPRTLSDIARERRGKAKPAGTVSFTDSTVTTGAEAASGAGAAEGGEPPPAARPAPAERSEEGWRKRMADARESVTRAEQNRQAAETALKGALAFAEGQYQTGAVREDMERRRAAAANAASQLDAARTRLKDLEEEARRSDVPPGWLR